MGASFVVFWRKEAHCTFAASIIRSPAMHGIFAMVTRERTKFGIATATTKQMIGIPKITILALCDIHANRHLRAKLSNHPAASVARNVDNQILHTCPMQRMSAFAAAHWLTRMFIKLLQ